jgi:hypothetical protein
MLVLVLGIIDKKLISKHKRTSIYEEEDFEMLISHLSDIEKLVVLPNIWTEVDNLLNGFRGDLKYKYFQALRTLINSSTERYLPAKSVLEKEEFWELGLTDSLLLQLSKESELLIPSDSRLVDYARSMNINTLDLVEQRNNRLKSS